MKWSPDAALVLILAKGSRLLIEINGLAFSVSLSLPLTKRYTGRRLAELAPDSGKQRL